LGTIADVVQLTGENRVLAVHGLRALPASRHPGIRALLESAQLTGEELDAYHVGFVLAPRLNASGRMGHARLAVELLTDVEPRRAKQIADYLNRQNTERQKVERAITAEAVETVTTRGLDSPEKRVIVLASENWHGGVIGIVASRLVERFARPAVLVAFNAKGGQGSARSIPGFHMRDALAACSEHLLSFGGHAMAGGLRIERERMDAFAAAMADYAEKNISSEQLAATLKIDAETTLPALSYNVVAHLERLGFVRHIFRSLSTRPDVFGRKGTSSWLSCNSKSGSRPKTRSASWPGAATCWERKASTYWRPAPGLKARRVTCC